MLEDIGNIKSGKKELCEFGLTIGIILVILGLIALWRHKNFYGYLLATGVLFIGLGLTVSQMLKPIQKIWMGISVIIGFFVSRLILSILFYAVLTPIGLAMRIFGKDVLDQRIEKDKISYWKDLEDKVKPKESYEKQY